MHSIIAVGIILLQNKLTVRVTYFSNVKTNARFYVSSLDDFLSLKNTMLAGK